jgi:hypothetical protein
LHSDREDAAGRGDDADVEERLQGGVAAAKVRPDRNIAVKVARIALDQRQRS